MRIGSFYRGTGGIHEVVAVAGDIGLATYIGHAQRVARQKRQKTQYETMTRRLRAAALYANAQNELVQKQNNQYARSAADFATESQKYSNLQKGYNRLNRRYTRTLSQWTDEEKSNKKTVLLEGAPYSKINRMGTRVEDLYRVYKGASNAITTNQRQLESQRQRLLSQQRTAQRATKRLTRYENRFEKKWDVDVGTKESKK